MKKTILSLFAALFALASCTQPVVEVFGSISGYVVDEDTGAAIGGARVTITPTGSSQVTSTDGEFLFDNLDAQEYTLSIKKDGYEDMSQKVSVKAGVSSSVQVALSPIQPILNVEQQILDFGDETTTLPLDITNTGKGVLEWTIDEEIDWITCSMASGYTTDKVTSVVIKASREGMEKGSYTETIVVSSNGGSAIVKVKMSVGNSIKISVNPDELDFGSLESQIQMTITNSGNSAVKYTASAANNWLTLSKTSSSVQTTDYIDAIVSREGLGAGSYTSSITISTDGGDLIIPVRMQVAEKSAPTVTLESVEETTYNSATVNGTIVAIGSAKVTRYGFCYSSTNQIPTVYDKVSNLGDCTAPKAFKSTLTNLESTTIYYVRAFAENHEGIAYSSVLTFTTSDLPKLAEVETGEASQITANTATVSGTIKSLGNVISLSAHGHVWNTTGNPTLTNGENTDLGEISSASAFKSNLMGLEAGTTYYVRAYATNEKGTAYGEEITFTTGLGDVELKTLEAKSITHESAVVSGEVVNDGKNEILEKGIVYATFAEPDRYDGRVAAEGEEFTCTLTGLSKMTTYHARAYVKTATGKYFYGNDVTFTTTEHVTEPTVATGQTDEVTHESLTIGGQLVSTGGTTVTEYGHVVGTDAEVTFLTCTRKSTFGPTDAPLEFTSELSGLDANTTYYVRAYATNAMGTVYVDAVTFTTEMLPVNLSDVTVTDVTKNSAFLNAEILMENGHMITEKGFGIFKKDSEEREYLVADDNFTLKVTGLESETEYWVFAYVETSDGKFFASKYYSIFTTLAAPANPTNGLYAYYTFEDNTTNTVSGAHNGSGINTSYVDGVQGSKALKFTSENSKLNIPEPLIDRNTFTLSFWVKDLNDGHIFSVLSSSNHKYSNILALTNGQLKYIQSGWSLWNDWNDEEETPLFIHSTLSSEWHHITITSNYVSMNKTEVCLYIDGEYIDRTTLQNQGGSSSGHGVGTKFVFGGPLSRSGYNLSLNWISMSIDNLRIYNTRVLTSEEVKQIYEYEK